MTAPIQQIYLGQSGVTQAAIDFLARTSGLDATHTSAYINLINGLVTDGIWSKLDVLRIYATQDSTTALLNLVSSNYNATMNGSPTFTADRGFTGSDGSSTIYLNSNFNPSTAGGNYTQTSAHISAWFLNTAAFGPPNGYSSGSGSDSYIWPRFSSDGKAYLRVNSNNAGNGSTPPAYDGHFLGDRNGGTMNYVRNGTSWTSLLPTNVALLNLNFYELGYNGNGTAHGSGSQQSMFSVGSRLSGATDWTNYYNRLRTYMTAVGVP